MAPQLAASSVEDSGGVKDLATFVQDLIAKGIPVDEALSRCEIDVEHIQLRAEDFVMGGY